MSALCICHNANLMNAAMWREEMVNMLQRKCEPCLLWRGQCQCDSTWQFCPCFMNVGWVPDTMTDQNCNFCSVCGHLRVRMECPSGNEATPSVSFIWNIMLHSGFQFWNLLCLVMRKDFLFFIICFSHVQLGEHYKIFLIIKICT